MVSLICGLLKNHANESIHKAEIDSQQKNFWQRGEGMGEG